MEDYEVTVPFGEDFVAWRFSATSSEAANRFAEMVLGHTAFDVESASAVRELPKPSRTAVKKDG